MDALPANRVNQETENESSDLTEPANHQVNDAPEPKPVVENPLPDVKHPVDSDSDRNWQSTKPTVHDRLCYMFHNEKLSDVHFIVGKDSSRHRIPAHKFVLSIGSPVFDAMFNGTLATDKEDIELPDVESPAFLSLLRFLYTDNVTICPESVMTTLYTAKKYAVPALESRCVEFLKSNLCADNAFMLLTQARLFDEHQLASLCLETIDKNTSSSLSADGFTDIDPETLGVFLCRDTLRISETKLYRAVLRWCECECSRQGLEVSGANMRSVLGSNLFLIRFPLMSVEEFALGPAQSGILTDNETVKMFLYYTLNPKPTNIPYKDSPRCSVSGKENVVNRFQSIENRWGYSGTSDRIRFVVDTRIFVVGFGLYGSFHTQANYEVYMKIETSCGTICGFNQTKIYSDGSSYIFRVMFKEPIEISPNTSYLASVTLKGPDSYYGTKGLWRVPVDCPSGKVTFQFYFASGSNNGTSVEDGQIPEIIFYT